MKLTIENFCSIKKKTEIEPRELTIFCGKNNTGKTYSLYMLNALMDMRLQPSFDFTRQHAKALLDRREMSFSIENLLGDEALSSAEKTIASALQKNLPNFFATEDTFGGESNFDLRLDREHPRNFLIAAARSGDSEEGVDAKGMLIEGAVVKLKLPEEWKSQSEVERGLNTLLMRLYFPRSSGRNFLLPAERSGLNLFFRELNSRRAALLRHVTSSTLDTAAMLKDILLSRYPRPIHDYIDFMNGQPEIKKQKSEFSDLAAWLQKQVLKVRYKVDRYGEINIEPVRTGVSLGLHMGSSTVKTFFGLWSYLNHLAKADDWLMIDEPELNLHPENQMLIARLLARLVNRGIRVVVSTHSDYMVREWGNLVMLGDTDFEGRDVLARKHGIAPEEFLSKSQVSAYEFSQDAAQIMPITADQGIQASLFDKSIEQINERTQDIYFSRQEASSLHEESSE